MKDPNYYADLYNSYEKNPKKIRVLKENNTQEFLLPTSREYRLHGC
jgi:hypothetical protein